MKIILHLDVCLNKTLVYYCGGSEYYEKIREM